MACGSLKSSSMAERGARHALHLLDGGTLTLTHQMVFLKGGFEQFTIPVPYFLVRHPDGNVLVDGGMQVEACVDPGSYLGQDLVAVMRPRVGPENHVLAQLGLLGVEPESIRYVVQTHLHFDHAGAIGHLPQATFLVHRRELAYANSPDWFVDAYNPRDFVRRSSLAGARSRGGRDAIGPLRRRRGQPHFHARSLAGAAVRASAT